MKFKDLLIGIFAIALLSGLGYLWLAPAGLTQAPDIELTTITGKKINLSSLRGRPVLVSFWATDCPGCIKEMPHLIELYNELAPQGFELLAIAMSYDPPNRVLAFNKARNLPFPVTLDVQGLAAQAFGDVRLTPTAFLIAPDGRVVHQKIGELDMERTRALIQGMLANSAITTSNLAAK